MTELYAQFHLLSTNKKGPEGPFVSSTKVLLLCRTLVNETVHLFSGF
jgi:hypothetical protein